MKLRSILAYATGAVLIALSSLMLVQPVNAQTKSAWTGCGAGLHGTIMQSAALALGGPLDVSATSQSLGASVLCDVQLDKFVVGGFVEYDRIYGNITKLGITGSSPSEVTVGGRVGWLTTQNALLYAHLGRGWGEFGGLVGNIESWKYGAGIDLKLPTAAPLFIDLRYTHSEYDTTGLIGMDARGDAVRFGLTFKFGGTDVTKVDPVQYVTPAAEPAAPVAPAPAKKSLK